MLKNVLKGFSLLLMTLLTKNSVQMMPMDRTSTVPSANSAPPLQVKEMERVFSSPVALLTVASATGTSGIPPMAKATHPVLKSRTVIGRYPAGCDIAFEDESTLSKQHTAIHVTNSGMVFIEDLGSTNGTYLLADPPVRLEPFVRYQWALTGHGSTHNIALGGLGKVVLSTSAVTIAATDNIAAVPATLRESRLGDDEDDDDDHLPPPPPMIERRKSQPDSEASEETTPAACGAGGNVVTSALPEAIDATLDYTFSSDVGPGAAASDGLASFTASPPKRAASSCVAESATPQLKTPLAASSEGDDADESPPPPSSLIRRRNLTSQLEAQQCSSSSSTAPLASVAAATSPGAEALVTMPTLDVSALSPAKLTFSDTSQEALRKPQPNTLPSSDDLSATPPPLRQRGATRAASEDATTLASTNEDETTAKKRARAPSAELVSTPSSPSEKRRGPRTETPVAVLGALDAHAPESSPQDPAPVVKRRAPPDVSAAPTCAPEVVSSPPVAAALFVVPTLPAAATPSPVWQFKVDLRKANARDEAWEDYSAADSARIEVAHAAFVAAGKKPKKTVTEFKLSTTYGVHFGDMVQFRFDDRSRQRPVRRKP